MGALHNITTPNDFLTDELRVTMKELTLEITQSPGIKQSISRTFFFAGTMFPSILFVNFVPYRFECSYSFMLQSSDWLDHDTI